MVSLSALRSFLAVAELGEIRAAAARLGRTPSAISMSLKQLEAEIGLRLFEGDRKNKLTATGSFVVLHAGEALRHLDRVEATIKEFVLNAAGRVDLACVPSVAAFLLPQVMPRFRSLAPRVSISLFDTDSRSVIRAVEKGEVGIGVASAALPQHSLSFSHLFSEPLGIVCRADHPLAGSETPVPFATFQGSLLITNNFTAMIDGGHAKDARRPQLAAFTVNSALGLVRSGLGVTVLSKLTVPDWDKELVFLPLRDEKAVRHVGIFTRSEEAVSPAEVLFISLLRDTVSATGHWAAKGAPENR